LTNSFEASGLNHGKAGELPPPPSHLSFSGGLLTAVFWFFSLKKKTVRFGVLKLFFFLNTEKTGFGC
jgi:hypothetical protein